MVHSLLALWLIACSRPGPPSLQQPIACVVGEDCWISKRPDVDPDPGVRDHSGTDFAVAHVGQAASTWVLAPAAGTVTGIRDGVPDGELTASGPAAVDDRECGNGVSLDLGHDWQLQLCHLKNGTVAVKFGDEVTAGQPVGRVGWSGQADHPHVHLTVWHAGRHVDPFTGSYLDDGTAAAGAPLWAVPLPDPSATDALAWIGFDAGPRAAMEDWPLDGGRAVVPATAPSLVLCAFLYGPEQGDIVRFALRRPDGTVTRTEWTQPRTRPRERITIDGTWPADERPVGLWSARVEWERGGRTRELRTSTVLR